jgi:hypothetical protein
MGLNMARPAAPAPPLQWPEWLVAMKDAELSIDRGKNPAGNSMLKARFVTGVPMSKLFEFYKSLLSTNGYKV